MAIISEKTKLQDLIRAMAIQYDMFLTNKQYQKTQFKDNESGYLEQQTKLAEEIKHEEILVKEILDSYFKKNFPDLNLIAYDSRYVSFNKARTCLGMLLIENMKEGDQTSIIDFFKHYFLMEVFITKFEELPIDLQKKFKK